MKHLISILIVLVALNGCVSLGPRQGGPTTQDSQQASAVAVGITAVTEGVEWAHALGKLDDDDYQLWLIIRASIDQVLSSVESGEPLNLLEVSRSVREALDQYHRTHPQD